MKSQRTYDAILATILLMTLAFMVKKFFYVPLKEAKYLLTYFILPGILVLGCGSAIRGPLSTKRWALFLIPLIGLSIYSVQFGLLVSRVMEASAERRFDSWQHRMAAKNAGKPFDKRSALELIDTFQAKGEEVVPVLPPSLFSGGAETITAYGKVLYPMAGISHAKTVYCNEGGEYLLYQSDEYGFNNPLGLSGRKLDVMAVGDSFAQGACVPNNRNAVVVIRDTFPSTVNRGYADNGPLTELATLKEFGPIEKPRHVVWLYYEGNDIDDLFRERQNLTLMGYLEPNFSQDLLNHQSEIDSGMRAIVAKRHTLALANTRRLLTTADLSPLQNTVSLDFFSFRTLRAAMGLLPPMPSMTEDRTHPNLPLLGQIALSAQREVKKWNGDLLFVYLPEWKSLVKPFTDHTEKPLVLEAFRAAGADVLDVTGALRAHADPLSLFPLRVHGHFNEEGYALVGREVVKRLTATAE